MAKKQGLVEAAMEVCAMIEDLDLEDETDEPMVAVLAARLLTEGKRELLLGLSKDSLGIISDEDIGKLVAELDDEDDDDEDDEDDEDEDDE
jgi:hypothetical protein